MLNLQHALIRLSFLQCRLTTGCYLMSMMTNQNKVTAAEVPPMFPETDLNTVNHGKVQVSLPLFNSL